MNKYYVYILTTAQNKVLYIGITNDMPRRLCEHQAETADSFTRRYHIHKLVYFEEYADPQAAICREKQLKKWTRQKKNALITQKNPNWNDLSHSFM